MRQNLPPKLRQFPAAKQRRLDQLLDKNSEGNIKPRELVTLKRLVAEAEELMVANSKELAEFSHREGAGRSPGAMPVTVTVWVQPQHAEP